MQTVGRFLSLGAGLQSSTLVEMIVEGDLPRVDAVLFADTKDEPKYVYQQVEYLRTRLATIDIPLVIVERPTLGLIGDIKQALTRIASMPLYTLNSKTGKRGILRRQCTREYKIDPFNQEIKGYLLEMGHARQDIKERIYVHRDVQVECWYGISIDEKYRMVAKDKQAWKKVVYPLADKMMSKGSCIRYLRERGLPIARKSSCKHCPYHDDAYWLEFSTNEPLEFEAVCQFDDWLRSDESLGTYFRRAVYSLCFLHSSLQPLREVDFAARIKARLAGKNPFQLELFTGATCATDGGASCMS